jgi:hypothetical protein
MTQDSSPRDGRKFEHDSNSLSRMTGETDPCVWEELPLLGLACGLGNHSKVPLAGRILLMKTPSGIRIFRR